jgi:hypothetical protein
MTPGDFTLTLWTSDLTLARHADAAGVQRIGVDLERHGKPERQRGHQTWISPHTLDDLSAVGRVLERASLFVRVNPLHDESEHEVEAVLAAGAGVLMLPMVSAPQEAAAFTRLVAGRALVVLLVECRAAIDALPDLVKVDGVNEIHLGLNDLALSLGLPNRWLVLAGNLVLDASAVVRRAGLRFGMGGIGRVDDGALPIPSDLVYAEYARTGATGAILARSFTAGSTQTLAHDVALARQRLEEWRCREVTRVDHAHAELRRLAQRLKAW